MKKKIRLSAAYMTLPIFDIGENYNPIELPELPISDKLKQDIQAWDNEYQDTFDSEYPPDSCFAASELKQAHSEKGHELAEKLQKELGDEYLVEYKI